MDLGDTNTGQLNYVHCSGYPHDEATIIKQSTDDDNYYNPLLTPPPPSIRKRWLSRDNEDELYVPAPKKFKASDAHHRIAIIIPTMAKRLQHNINTYSRWRKNGFDVVLVINKNEEEAVTNILQQAPKKMAFVTHPYTTSSPSNAGIAKHNAYSILQEYLNRPDFQFALLLDDTVDEIINTCTETSIVTTPTEFYHAVKKFAKESPVFGGTVAAQRNKRRLKKKCNQKK
jgi:hypothetical protein